ncbi:sugar ABC transporter permease [Glycomyces sp. L485]|uniref:carbohydrate ABC transporter permease n=1 Tax=Glycomyces sp. L485 TaxID=2909235 RepID=UPI001F4AD6E4|nr:sugar ABC transporter permease [Glycomyces sp. L485]MCH7229435.1 sugar ABC transporter permease [Glycomyces sp. L485]
MTTLTTRTAAPTTQERATSKPRRHGARWAAVAFVAPLVIYLLLFYAYPLAQNLSMSLHRFDRGTFINGGAPFVGTEIYQDVVEHPRFWTIVRQTTVFTAASLVFQYLIGLALAVFFHRGGFRLAAPLRAMFLVPWLLPIIVSGTTWQWMMNPDDGILNSFIGLFGADPVWWLSADNALMSVAIANIWLGIPFNLVILYSGLQGIPKELYEAASMDGATPWQQFWRITLPMLRPVSLITLLLGLVYTLKVVDIIWIMTLGTGTSQTLATWAYGMSVGKGASAIIRYSEASAVGTILLLAALAFGLIYIAAQRKQED